MSQAYKALQNVIKYYIVNNFSLNEICTDDLLAWYSHKEWRYIEKTTNDPNDITHWCENTFSIKLDNANQIIALKNYIFLCPLHMSVRIVGAEGWLYTDMWYKWKLLTLHIYYETTKDRQELTRKLISEWVEKLGLSDLLSCETTDRTNHVTFNFYYPFYATLEPYIVMPPSISLPSIFQAKVLKGRVDRALERV